MEFKDFIGKLASVLRGGDSTDKFARTVFEAIVAPNDAELISAYSAASFKAFFNGTTSISGIAKKINAHTERMEFEAYIETFPDGAVESLCNVFATDIPEINLKNAGEKISKLFVAIITEAAASKRKGQTDDGGAAPNGTANAENDNAAGDFSKYLKAAKEHYSTKKTLLYAEKPHPFYELYVCNDIHYKKATYESVGKSIHDATVDKLKAKHIIICGTGGIGKSMFMTHLFLSSANLATETGSIPLLLLLKDYKKETSSLVDFITNSAKEFAPEVSKEDVTSTLKEGKLILLLDGLDEIKTDCIEKFEKEIDSFTKTWSNNTVIITSRPTNKFISYSKFMMFDIMPLTQEQSVALIKKLEFWDEDAKRRFLGALETKLYDTHSQFASNPLLLTIMLMTYSSHGEIPEKMHVFYSRAYDTMARLHDATKGSFSRPLHTGLTPEEFAKYFAEFCARTYKEEKFSFDLSSFSNFMDKSIKNSNKIEKQNPKCTSYNFSLDLTENLCLMYSEGYQYYFIHRSFQEYFSAVYFSSIDDSKLKRVGDFFENKENRSSSDNTFGMLYNLIPEKVEKFIFLPFLEEIVKKINEDERGPYWGFLSRMYPTIYIDVGEVGYCSENKPSSFLYSNIIERYENIKCKLNTAYHWPDELFSSDICEYEEKWVYAYSDYATRDRLRCSLESQKGYIPEEPICSMELVAESDLPFEYSKYFDAPEVEGTSYALDINDLYDSRHVDVSHVIVNFIEQDDFPLKKEFNQLLNYYKKLQKRIYEQDESDGIFDD